MSMKKDNLVSKIIHKCFNENLDFRVRTFNTLGILGFALSIVFGFFSLLIHAEILYVTTHFGASVIAVAVIWRANSTGHFKRYFLVTVIVVFLVLFPFLFFMGGGYKSGMPSFFVFAVVFTVIMLEGRRRAVLTVLEIALYSACFMIAYFYPEIVVPFPAETDMARDIIAGSLASSVVVAVAIYQHIIVYDRKQKELERANDQLQGLNRMKIEFLQNISHELKTPITVISNYARDTLQELGKIPQDIPEMEFNQNRIVSESARLSRMVSQLLDVTAIDSGRLHLRRKPLSFAAMIRRIADADFNIMNGSGNTLSLEITENLPDIYADSDAIEQVLLNLLSNAVRHTSHGTITVSLTPEDGYQKIQVCDNGEGMRSEVLRQVFIRYVERENRVSGNSGLGLYICKKLIDAHGGDICIESEPDKGTRVWFRLSSNETDGKGI